VVLNDNDMSIAPPVGALSGYLARLISGRTYMSLRDIGKQLAHKMPKGLEKEGAAGGGIRARLPHRRHECSRSSASIMSADRRPQSRSPAAVLKKRARRQARSDPGSRRDAEGKGYERLRNRRQISWRGEVRRRHRRAGEAKSNAPQYTKVFAESLIKEARKDDRIVAVTAAMPSGTGLDLFGKEFPARTFRCRHRRAAWRDVLRRTCERRLQAVRRDLFDLPAARLRPGGA